MKKIVHLGDIRNIENHPPTALALSKHITWSDDKEINPNEFLTFQQGLKAGRQNDLSRAEGKFIYNTLSMDSFLDSQRQKIQGWEKGEIMQKLVQRIERIFGKPNISKKV